MELEDRAEGTEGSGEHAPGGERTEPDSAEPRPATAEEAALFSERGRDLLMLALGLILINEAIFIGVTGGSPSLVAALGRFAALSAMSYMTWQGFAISRWVLVVLTAVYALGGVFQVLQAFAGELPLEGVLLALAAAGYTLSFFLLAFQGDVGRFIVHRRLLRERDVMR